MNSRNIIWPPVVREKLSQFRSEHFTPEETLNFIYQVVLETEELLKNKVVTQTYTEEYGDYRGLSRIIIRKFRVYFKRNKDDIIILAILFPGEK